MIFCARNPCTPRTNTYVALSAQLPDGKWQEVAKGQSVGHKRIEQFAAVEATAVRLRVDKSKAEPQVRKLAAYGGG